MDINKRRMLMKAFVSSQFSYCPLIWIFHSRKMEHRINNIHQRALKLVCQDSLDLTFQELLVKDKSVSVHQKNFRLLVTEIFKCKTGMSPELMNDIFHFVEGPPKLRSDYTLERKGNRTFYHGSESLSSLAPKLWDLLPNSIKNSASLTEFKTNINNWAFERCPCRICKKYVGRVGFILSRSIGFSLLVLSCFYVTICIYFLVKSCNLYFIQISEIFNFIYSRLQILCIHVYIF